VCDYTHYICHENFYLVVVSTGANSLLGYVDQTISGESFSVSANAEWRDYEPQGIYAQEHVKFGIVISKASAYRNGEVSRETLTKEGTDIPLTRYEEGESEAWVSYSAALQRGVYEATSFMSFEHQVNGSEASVSRTITIDPYVKSTSVDPIDISSTANGTVSGSVYASNVNIIDDMDIPIAEEISTDKFSFDYGTETPIVDFDAFGVKVNVANLMSVAGASEKWGTSREATVKIISKGTNGDITDSIDDFNAIISVAVDGDILTLSKTGNLYQSQNNNDVLNAEVTADGITTFSGLLSSLVALNNSHPGSISVVSSDPAIIEVSNISTLKALGATGESATITVTFVHPVSGVSATQDYILTIERYLTGLSGYGQTVSAVANMKDIGTPIAVSLSLTDSEGGSELLDLSMTDIQLNSSNQVTQFSNGELSYVPHANMQMTDDTDNDSGVHIFHRNANSTGLAAQLGTGTWDSPWAFFYHYSDADAVVLNQLNSLVVGDNIRCIEAVFSAVGQNYQPMTWLTSKSGLDVTVVSPANVTMDTNDKIVIPADLADATDVVIEVSFTHPVTGVNATGQITMTYNQVV